MDVDRRLRSQFVAGKRSTLRCYGVTTVLSEYFYCWVVTVVSPGCKVSQLGVTL